MWTKNILLLIAIFSVCGIPSWAQSESFSPIFGVEVFMDQQPQVNYEFEITPSGLLCPMRHNGSTGSLHFFSSIESNRGCLPLSQFKVSSQLVSQYSSTRDAAAVDSNGVRELPGKIFRVTATRIGSPEITTASEGSELKAVNLLLSLSGKTYVNRAGMKIWAQGNYVMSMRFERNTDGHWRSMQYMPQAIPGVERVMYFNDVQVFLTSPNELSSGIGRILGSTGTEKSPIQIQARPQNIFYKTKLDTTP